MLSLFPDLLTLSWFSAALVRMTLAGVLLTAAWKHSSSKDFVLRGLGILEFALVLLLIAGAWVQAVALISLFVLGSWYMKSNLRPLPLSTILLAAALALSLLMTGAGPFAFDMPL